MHKIREKIEKVPKQLKATVILFAASCITSTMSFLLTPVFTRLMSVEEYGLVAQFISWQEIITVIATLSLTAGVFAVAMNEFPDDRDVYTFSSLLLSAFTTTVVFGIIFIFKDFFLKLFELPLSLVILMFLYMLLHPAMGMWLERERYEYNYKNVFIISVGSTLLSQVVAVILVMTLKNTNLGIAKAWGNYGIMALCSLGVYIYIAAKAKFKVKFKYIKYAFIFNAPLLIHYLAQYVLRSTDKIMITHFWGEGATGIYSLGSTVASIAILIWAAMSASLTPYMYEHINTKEYDKVNRAVVGVELIFAVGCFVVSVIGPEFVYILGSEKYMEGINLIPPVAASCLLSAVYSFYSTMAFYYHKRVSTAVLTVVAAVVNIVLNYIFIPKFGYVAAAYTTEAAYLVYTFLHFLNYRRIVGKEKVFNDKAVMGIVAATTVLCLASGLLYDYWIVRYSLVAAILVVLVIYREKIIGLVKTLLGKNEVSADE